MIIRLVGAVLVSAGGAWLGFQAASGLKRRAEALREMAEGLALLERELALSAPPLPRLLARGAAGSRGPARRLFQSCLQGMDNLGREDFASLWRRAAEGQAELGREGLEALAPLGGLLGRYDALSQAEGLACVRRRLEELSARQEEDCRRQGRVYQALGLSGGAFLVILLL